MRITLGSRSYLITFKNVSEKLIHGPDGPMRPSAAVPDDVQFAYQKYRRYLRLKPPTRISVITTTCTIWELIANEAPIPISKLMTSFGQSYYSQSEVLAGIPFDRTAARARSLKRAMGSDVVLTAYERQSLSMLQAGQLLNQRKKEVARHRSGPVFPPEARVTIWQAFTELTVKRSLNAARKATQTGGQASAPPAADGATPV